MTVQPDWSFDWCGGKPSAPRAIREHVISTTLCRRLFLETISRADGGEDVSFDEQVAQNAPNAHRAHPS